MSLGCVHMRSIMVTALALLNLEVYYRKIKNATNSVTAFEFYQAEIYLLTQIRANIMQQIPTYGALRQNSK